MNGFVLVLVVVLVLEYAEAGWHVENENEDEWVCSWKERTKVNSVLRIPQ